MESDGNDKYANPEYRLEVIDLHYQTPIGALCYCAAKRHVINPIFENLNVENPPPPRCLTELANLDTS